MRKSQSLKSFTQKFKSDNSVNRDKGIFQSAKVQKVRSKNKKRQSDKAKKIKRHKRQSKKTIKAPYGDVRNDREMIARMKAKNKIIYGRSQEGKYDRR